jgi:hypothetical protein
MIITLLFRLLLLLDSTLQANIGTEYGIVFLLDLSIYLMMLDDEFSVGLLTLADFFLKVRVLVCGVVVLGLDKEEVSMGLDMDMEPGI